MNEPHAATVRLLLIALIKELPDDCRLEVNAHHLSREDFDRLPGENERRLRISKFWAKDIRGPGVLVTLFTDEPPLRTVGFGRLELVDGGGDTAA